MIWSSTHLTLTLFLFYLSVYIDAEQDRIKTQECCGGVCRGGVVVVELTFFASFRSCCLNGSISSVHRCGS
ncbi:MAG: hypothetical protein J3Q66DRAFT_360374 [Benniella sp.]|nr:MAG: hypothetical protein J3Q66DRAFT_360374 [Benniella sp.]